MTSSILPFAGRRTLADVGRSGRIALAVLLATLALYGCWSTPTLIGRWGASAGGLALLAGWTGLAMLIVLRTPSRATWLFFAAAAVALRVGSAVLAAGRVSPGDSELYLELARHLLDGQGLVVREPFIDLDMRGFYPPLYPVLLAGWAGLAGFGGTSLLLLSTTIDLGAAALIVTLGGRLGRRDAGWAAAALYLIWPGVLLSAPLAQKEGLATLCALALANGWLAVLQAEHVRPWRNAWRIGAPAAALALTQPGQAPLALLFGLALMPAFGWRRVLAGGVPAAVVAGIAMLPWWVRNAVVFGRFVPLTTASGVSLWVGSSAGATGGWMPSPRAGAGADEIGYAQALGQVACDWIVQHPGQEVRLYATKFVRALALGQSGVTRLAAMRPPLGPQSAAAILPLAQGAQILLLGGAAVGLRASRLPRDTLLLPIVAATLAQLLLFALPFEFAERHRDFTIPFLLLLVVCAWAPTANRPTSV